MPATGGHVHSAAVLPSATRLTRARCTHSIPYVVASDNESYTIHGTTLSRGRAYGLALQFDEDAHVLEPEELPHDDSPHDALNRLDTAFDRTRAQLNELMTHGSERFEDIVELVFRAHLLMLDDEMFGGRIRELVTAGTSPERAVTDTIEDLARSFTDKEHALTAEKAEDVRDLGYRLLANLAPDPPTRTFVAGKIVLLEHVFPSELLRLAIDGAAGLVLVEVAVTAHLSILAHSLGVPVLATSWSSVRTIRDGTPLIVDGNAGRIEVLAGADTVGLSGSRSNENSATISIDDAEEPGGSREEIDPLPAEASVKVLASVNILADALAARRSADGIGLYRSEFPFIIRKGLLDEQTQYHIYRHIVSMFSDREVTLRTADIGGDKILEDESAEANPFLGVRGIRFSLANRPMFRDQLRAMLRAGEGADLRIMLPMVSTVEEVLEARTELDRCLAELSADGTAHNAQPKLGAMIEIPSAAVGADEIAAETDFLSIGMNDLVMYMLAVDRTNARLADHYRTHHPVIVRTVAAIADSATDAGIPLSICGEAAADPLLLPLYVGLGAGAVSVAPEQVVDVRRRIASLDVAACRELAETVRTIKTVQEMEAALSTMAPAEAGRTATK